MSEFLTIAWPGLLTLAGYLALIVHANREYRRKHRRGKYRIHRADSRGELVRRDDS